MDAQVILKRLVEMAGGSADRGYILALATSALGDVPGEFVTGGGKKYTVVTPNTEIGLRHVLWKASGAPLLALLEERLARVLPADLVRSAQGGRVHAVEPAEVLSLALQVPIVPSEDESLLRLALDHVEKLQAALRQRTLPTVVDRELLDELLLDVLLDKAVRKCKAGELLADWLRTPPTWEPAVEELVQRQLPRIHGLEGRILEWASHDPKRFELLIVYGVLMAIDERELPQSAWNDLWGVERTLGLTRETFRKVVGALARQTLDALGVDAMPWLVKAGKVAARILTPTVLSRSRDLPLGLDNLCAERVREMVQGGAVTHAQIQEMRDRRFSAARETEIAVIEEMARLSRYLAAPAVAATAKVVDRVRAYQREGAFADWAATRLRTSLAKTASYRKEADRVLERYRDRRNEENQRFAEALREDYVGAIHSDGCVPLHRIWAHGPVRSSDQDKAPIFLVVLDGCSYPVFLALLAELSGDKAPMGLRVEATADGTSTPAALSILPTITSHARAAIFLGEVPKDPWIAETVWRGTSESTTDPARFKQNQALGGRTRKLFLKGDLADHGDGLYAALRDESVEVVAVVFNAVDDQISSSNTGATTTVRAAEISAFIPSLRAAFRAKRRVVVTADHGHSPFLTTKLRVGEGASARYRIVGANEAVPEGFIEIADGGLGGGPGRKAFAWKMGVYQGQPQVGFHGGCSLEEMVVPLAELVEDGVAADEPAFWYGGGDPATPPKPRAEAHSPPPPAPVAAAPAAPRKVQGDLFDPLVLLIDAAGRTGIPDAVSAKLDRSELAALGCVFLNQHARVSDIATALKRNVGRVPGLMSRLVNKLHTGNFPCLRRQALPDGEDQYTYVRQGTET